MFSDSSKTKEKAVEPVATEEVVDDVEAEVQEAVEAEPVDMELDSL